MDNPFLSISIPTFNRSELLRDTLSNVLAQIDALDVAPGSIEVVVTSNASTDHTGTMVRDMAQRHPSLRYFENDKNYGIDGNIHRAVVNARGRFVHLLSDDDVLLDGLYRQLYSDLRNNDDIKFLFLNAQPLTKDDAPSAQPVVALSSRELVRLPKDDFVSAVGVWMTFVSSFVTERQAWLGTHSPERHIGTDIYLTYVAFEVLANAGFGYVSTSVYIKVRPVYSGSFRIFKAFAQEWRRLLLEYSPRLGFNQSAMRRIFVRSIKHHLPGFVLIAKTSSTLSARERAVLISNTWDFAAAWLYIYPIVYLPLSLVQFARRVRNAKRALGSRRA